MLAVCAASIVVTESTQCNDYLLMFFPGHYWTLFLISSSDFRHKITTYTQSYTNYLNLEEKFEFGWGAEANIVRQAITRRKKKTH